MTTATITITITIRLIQYLNLMAEPAWVSAQRRWGRKIPCCAIGYVLVLVAESVTSASSSAMFHPYSMPTPAVRRQW